MHSQGIVIIKILALVITVISRFVSVLMKTKLSFASRLAKWTIFCMIAY